VISSMDNDENANGKSKKPYARLVRSVMITGEILGLSKDKIMHNRSKCFIF